MPRVPTLLVAGLAFVLTALVARGLVGWLRRWGLMDPPVPGFQHQAVPRGGGLAILVVVTSAAAWLLARGGDVGARAVVPIVAAAVVGALSFVDDVHDLPAWLRLAVHVALAVIVVARLGPVREVAAGPLGTWPLGAAAWPLTLLWIVGLTNAFNFMDGIDAMAGVMAIAPPRGVATSRWWGRWPSPWRRPRPDSSR